MKTCVTCKTEKPLDEFNKFARSKDGKQPRCRPCAKAWYQDNKQSQIDRVVARNKAWRAELKLRVQELKRKPCLDCGNSYPPCVMDFDHVRGEKKIDVSALLRGAPSWDMVLREVAKCDLVCANCHRIRTGLRAGWITE